MTLLHRILFSHPNLALSSSFNFRCSPKEIVDTPDRTLPSFNDPKKQPLVGSSTAAAATAFSFFFLLSLFSVPTATPVGSNWVRSSSSRWGGGAFEREKWESNVRSVPLLVQLNNLRRGVDRTPEFIALFVRWLVRSLTGGGRSNNLELRNTYLLC